MRLLFLAALATFISPALAQDPGMAQPRAAAGSRQTVVAGQALFERTCGACHGANARGGRNGAPDLLASDLALGDLARFAGFVRAGAPSAGMPGFALDDASLALIHEYLELLRQREPPRGRKTFVLVGNAARGRVDFDGHCAQCHSVEGDLKGIGSRYPPRVLQGRIVMPRGSG